MKNTLVFGIYYDKTLVGLMKEVLKYDKKINVGYCILPTYQNRGIATKALQMFIDYVFNHGYEIVKAGFIEGNIASQRVMEKCHMVNTGIVGRIKYQGKINKYIYYEIKKNK